MTEQLIDLGDGSGDFRSVKGNKTITFLSDGTYTSNGSICEINDKFEQSTTGTYDADKMMLSPDCSYNGNPYKFDVSYKVEQLQLILRFPYIESCLQKFKKIAVNTSGDD